MRKKIFKILGAVVLLLLVAGGIFAWRFYEQIYGPNVSVEEGETIFLIPTGSEYEEVKEALLPYLKDVESFEWVSRKKNYRNKVKPGRYLIEDGWSNNHLVNTLRAGNQEPVNLVIYSIKNAEQLAGLLGAKLEPDSLDFLRYFRSREALANYDLEPQELLYLFIPNTYEFYWNSSPAFTLARMKKERDKFWEQRKDELAAITLSRDEVITLASIVESETVKKDEMPTVAGLYLNRLERGMRLQSDPTVIHGYNLDYPREEIRRVLYRHLDYDSPYNTYLYKGLPPGPIRLPSVAAIDAVLQAENHDYIFMAANPERPGYHSFARNNREHEQNAQKYRRWYEEQQRLARENN